MLCDKSRKTDLIVRIQMARLNNGMTAAEARDSTLGYRRKKVQELLTILRREREGDHFKVCAAG